VKTDYDLPKVDAQDVAKEEHPERMKLAVSLIGGTENRSAKESRVGLAAGHGAPKERRIGPRTIGWYTARKCKRNPPVMIISERMMEGFSFGIKLSS
jgi:hypothetical protein